MESVKVYFRLLINLLSRLLCWRRNRHRRTSGSLLPTTVNLSETSNEPSSIPQSPTYMYSSSSIVNSYTSNVNGTWNLMQKSSTAVAPQAAQNDIEPDYFQELQPTIKRQKKILINQNESGCKLSERLNVNVNTFEMPAVDDSANAWDDESIADEGELNQSLKSIKAIERERRIAEHQKAIQQKEQLRKAKAQKANFMATKIN